MTLTAMYVVGALVAVALVAWLLSGAADREWMRCLPCNGRPGHDDCDTCNGAGRVAITGRSR